MGIARRPAVWGSSRAEEVAGRDRGLRSALPAEEGVVFPRLGPVVLGPVLRDLARPLRLAAFRKRPGGPKKPGPKHVSTAKLLNARELNT